MGGDGRGGGKIGGGKRMRAVVCNVCGADGHMSFACPERICRNCGERGHLMNGCPIILCNYCGDVGHTKYFCPRLSLGDAGARTGGLRDVGVRTDSSVGVRTAVSEMRSVAAGVRGDVAGGYAAVLRGRGQDRPQERMERNLSVTEEIRRSLDAPLDIDDLRRRLSPEFLLSRRDALDREERAVRSEFGRRMEAIKTKRAELEVEITAATQGLECLETYCASAAALRNFFPSSGQRSGRGAPQGDRAPSASVGCSEEISGGVSERRLEAAVVQVVGEENVRGEVRENLERVKEEPRENAPVSQAGEVNASTLEEKERRGSPLGKRMRTQILFCWRKGRLKK